VFTRPFGYVRATGTQEACELLERFGETAKLLAGGQSLMPMVNLGLAEPSHLIDISRAPGLSGITESGGYLRIGALTRHRALGDSPLIQRALPLLAEAVRHVGNGRVRNRGTIAGSVAHADPAAELPLVLMMTNARYVLTNGHGTRTVMASDFAVSYFTTRIEPTEMLTEVWVPDPSPQAGWGFRELSRRPGDFAVAAAAALVWMEGDRVTDLRIGLAGVADRPVRPLALEQALRRRSLHEIGAAVDDVDLELHPVTDSNASAEYRRHVARVLVRRALEDACSRAGESP
jgi:aerobic carbon-monoxide dehydrogenase medium subunit